MKNFYVTLVSVALTATFAMGQTVVYPSQDMTTQTGNSGMNPSDDQLWIANWDAMQNYHQIVIQFDLSQFEGQDINSAILNLYQFFHAPDGSPTPSKIYAASEQWDENTWESSTNVSHAGTEYATPEFTATTGWYEIDITSLVQEWVNGDLANNGLVIIANSGTKFAEFYSKETTDEDKKPHLEIETGTGITNSKNKQILCNIYPNPATDNTTIEFDLNTNQLITVKLFDLSGLMVSQTNTSQYVTGKNTQTIDCRNLPEGIYMVQIATNTTSACKKLIIKH